MIYRIINFPLSIQIYIFDVSYDAVLCVCRQHQHLFCIHSLFKYIIMRIASSITTKKKKINTLYKCIKRDNFWSSFWSIWWQVIIYTIPISKRFILWGLNYIFFLNVRYSKFKSGGWKPPKFSGKPIFTCSSYLKIKRILNFSLFSNWNQFLFLIYFSSKMDCKWVTGGI